MKDVIEKLLAVQELDEEIIALEKKLEEGPRRLDEKKAELERHRERHEEAVRRAKEAARAGERKNTELESLDQKMKSLALQQNTARTNKEYEAFKHEIATLKADFEIVEEEALQQWSVGEEREKEAASELEQVRGFESEIEREQAEVEREAEGLRGELETLRGERSEKVREVPERWLKAYERVVSSRGTPAIVEVVEQYCQGCQMSVTVHDLTRALRSSEVVQCKACSRILYAETP